MRRLAWLAVCGLLACLPAQEKLSVLGPSPATVKLGEAARVELRIEGRTADPRPPRLPEVPGLLLELSAPSREIATTFVNGRTTQLVTVSYLLVLRPQREGSFVVPPFPCWTGSREQTTPELRLDARRDLRGEDLGWLQVEVEPQRVYVHEPIRVRVLCGIDRGLRLVQDRYDRYLYNDLEVQAPWLNEFPGGERIELPAPTGDLKLIVGNRQLFQAAFDGNYERNGKLWHVFRFERAFLPTRTGRIELPAPMLRYHVLIREGQQDLFGRPRGQQTDNLYATGQPVTIEVLPIPEVGRPTPYYGAVGRFAIEATLDREVVKVGGSVKLTLLVRGQGNCEFLRMPPLDELPGFHKLGQAEARREADKVVVTYDFAPLSDAVREFPAIGWNYFDTTPGVERFVEVATPVLPLKVLPLADGETLVPLANEALRSVTPGVDDIHDLPDFAGAPAPYQPVVARQAWLATGLPWVLGALLLVGARWWRARAADHAGARARGAARNCRRELAAGGDPLQALLQYLADRLDVAPAALLAPDLAERLHRVGLQGEDAAAVLAAIERGTAARYGGAAALTAPEVGQLVARLEPLRLVARGLLPWLLCGLGAAFGSPLAAQGGLPAPQDPALVESISAYRAKDYATAEAGFAAVFAATGDRRCWQAIGNCHFRRGDLPRALWAYECARLGLPRDAELLANLQLVRQRLQLEAAPPGMLADLAILRDRLLPGERLWLLAFLMSGSAALVWLGWRRVGCRWLAVILLAPAVWLALDLGVWLPARPPLAIAGQELSLVAEPSRDLPALATVRAGKEVLVLGSALGSFVRVRVGERVGYVESARLLLVQ